MFTRSRNSKKLRFRGSCGQFARTPSLGMEVCKHCQGIYAPFTYEQSPAGFTIKKRVCQCPHCNDPV